MMNNPHSLYLHIPFCRHRCAYCDFNTYAGQEDSISAYVQALCNEIQFAGRGDLGRLEVHTIFFGGGTPSLLSPVQFGQIFSAISKHFDVAPNAEISIEANPGTTSQAYLRELRATGVNRISFGVQSADPGELRMLERIHDFFDVIDAVTWARKAGFDNLNLDLIYGLPGQRLEQWQSTVRRVMGLNPEHVSAYSLTVEHGTPFGRWGARGLMPMPDPDAAAEMVEWAAGFLAGQGIEQYEISNWARVGRECRHNLQYWRNLPYLGLGAGAHGYAGGVRYSNVLRIKTYIERLSSKPEYDHPFPLTPATVNQHHNSLREDMDETMMTGLRLLGEGVSAQAFLARFGVKMTDVYGKDIGELITWGLLEWSGDRLHLSARGWLLGNQVFMRFVG